LCSGAGSEFHVDGPATAKLQEQDRSGLCVSLERQGRHAQLNAGIDGWGSRRPLDTWWRESSAPGCEDCWTPARTVY